jgi:hypothetical protein
VSLLLSRLASRLHPWLTLGRGMRLLRAGKTHSKEENRRQSTGFLKFWFYLFFLKNWLLT